MTPKYQQQNQVCCAAFGQDACAEGLYCDSLPPTEPGPTYVVQYSTGRCQSTQPGADMTPCEGDSSCASGRCNQSTPGGVHYPPLDRCESQLGSFCNSTIGCAPLDGRGVVCIGTPPTCQIAPGTTGARCVLDSECASGVCRFNGCLGANLDGCLGADECASGTCVRCSYADVMNPVCVPASPGLCMVSCGNDANGNPMFLHCMELGQPCNGYYDCRAPSECIRCVGSAVHAVCTNPQDQSECLNVCPDGNTWSTTC
jgi:hypothetical protein